MDALTIHVRVIYHLLGIHGVPPRLMMMGVTLGEIKLKIGETATQNVQWKKAAIATSPLHGME